MKLCNNLFWYVLQVIVSIFRKDSLVIDIGIFIVNVVIIGNLNVIKDVESENYNKICEFFGVEIDVFLVFVVMNYFGVEFVNDLLKRNVFFLNLYQGSMEEKRKWFCEYVVNLFD